jgi:hypothetical protein
MSRLQLPLAAHESARASAARIATATDSPESAEDLHPFSVAYIILWCALLVFVFFTRRRLDAVRAQLERIESAAQRAAD